MGSYPVCQNAEFVEFLPQEFFSDTDRMFVLGRYAGKIKTTGRTFAAEWVHVFTIRDGQVTHFRECADTAQFAEGFCA